MSVDIRSIGTMNRLITYFVNVLNWDIDEDDFDDVEDISYEFEAQDLGLKEEAFAKIKSLRQLQPLVDVQKWGIFSVEFDSKKFEVTALRKVLSGLIPKKRNSADHAVWDKKDLLFICYWGEDNNRTIGIAHFEDKEVGLPQIKMIYCAPQIEDTINIQTFEARLKNLTWPVDVYDTEKWHDNWSKAFTTGYKQIINDSSMLTLRLAEEAHKIRDRILETMKVETDNGYVHLLFEKFKSTLIHDMTEKQFADMYAQTVVYGLFSARCMDDTQEDFSAEEAVECIPNTNPFLKNLMRECLGSQNTSKLSYDELEIGNVVELLLNTRTDCIIQDFNRQTGGGKEDPVIHFYEEFLTAYDKDQKVQRGVFYTPQPVVNFIVRAVDSIIKNEFGFEDGLASTEMKTVKYMRDSKKKVDGFIKEVEDTKEVPAIQILDPSTGTGTFLRQTILQIYENFKEKYKGTSSEELKKAWNEYVPKHLLPRLNGFELMMAPYAVAHMKLAMVLGDSGYDFSENHRLQVYLTNSLEKPGNASAQMTIMDDPLATESIEANDKKVNSKLNIVVGNPPYSGESANKNEWITELMEVYKKEPGGVQKLNEKNPKWLNDDYVKFIRYGQFLIDEAGAGILAYICPHGFLDNPTFRGMRWNLLCSFERIYIIDLHGNINKHEVCPDGSKDENVFDIQQGVCIVLAIKKTNSSELAEVYHANIYGVREKKYKILRETDYDSIGFERINFSVPQYCFVPRDTEGEDEYNDFFSLKELFPCNSMGVVTAKDKVLIGFTRESLEKQVEEYYKIEIDKKKEFKIDYRPFDKRYIYYDTDLIERSRENVMPSFGNNENLGIVFRRQSPDTMPISYFFVCDSMMADGYIRSDNKGGETVAPLFLYEDTFVGKRLYNLSDEIIKRIENRIGRELLDQEEYDETKFFSGFELICYIYARAYSPLYREKYGRFIRVDYPRIPFPQNNEVFNQYVSFGKRLIDLHLKRSNNSFDEIEFKGAGNNDVETKKYDAGRIFINRNQYFEPVSESQWLSYYGGYQPLQKWLKDHKGMTLTEEDINTYKMLIVSLEKTSLIQEEIKKFEESNAE